jgi:hypothetical protein
MFELLKRVHHEIGERRQDVSETKRELNVMRGHWWQRKAIFKTFMAFSPDETNALNA